MNGLSKEMTASEDILALDIGTAAKDRILAKLSREYLKREEFEAALAKEKEHWHRQSSHEKETNIALVDACVGLAKVVQIQLKERF